MPQDRGAVVALMACQKGPGEGYMAAKDAALALAHAKGIRLRCHAVDYRNHNGARTQRLGYVVEDLYEHRVFGKGTLSRDAWSDAYFKLGGKFPVPHMK